MFLKDIYHSIERRGEGRLTVLSACMAMQLILSIVLGMLLDPGGESFVMAFTIVGCTAMMLVVMYMPQANRISVITLCVAAMIMTFGAWLNIRGYTHDTFTLNSPDFNAEDPFDSFRDFERAKIIARQHLLPSGMSGNNAYPMMVALLFMMFGINIIWPIALNMGFSLGTIALTGAICAKLMPDYGRRRMAMCGMIMATCISGILMHGTLLLKDAPVMFAIALFAYSLVLTIRNEFGIRAIITAAAAAMVLMLSRPTVAVFLLVGVVLMIPRFNFRTHQAQGFSSAIFYSVLLLAVLCASASMVNIGAYSEIAGADSVTNRSTFLDLPTVQRYSTLLHGYYERPVWQRLIWLPFTCIAQYFPPFPWNFTRDLWMGEFYWFAHIPIGWYAVGGLIIAYFIFCCFRKSGVKRLNMWAVWFVLCYIGVAYFCAGTVPRYYLPFIPIGIPLAACVAYQVWQNIVNRKQFVLYCVSYLVLLAIGLSGAYIFLKL